MTDIIRRTKEYRPYNQHFGKEIEGWFYKVSFGDNHVEHFVPKVILETIAFPDHFEHMLWETLEKKLEYPETY